MIKRSFISRDKNIITNLYLALVRPHLEYANVIWHPYLKRQSAAIEKVQKRATRLIPECKNLSYQNRLKMLKLPSLKFRRIRGDLIQTFKILNKLDNVDIDDIFTMSSHSKTRNSLLKIFTPYARTNVKKFSFSNRVCRYWNPLRNVTKTAKSANAFKNLLRKEIHIEKLKFLFD